MMATEEPAAAAALFACRTCGPLSRSAFHPSCISRCIHRCKQCTQAKNKKYFQSAKDTTLREWRIRKRVSGGLKISRIELAKIFEVQGRRCFITSLSGPLTLLRADPDREFTAANAVPVLSKIASSLTHGLPDDALKRWRMRIGTARGQPSATGTEVGVVHGKELRMEESPFSATEELGVAAVSDGGRREDAHEEERPMRAILPLPAITTTVAMSEGTYKGHHHAESTSRLINEDAGSNVLRRAPPPAQTISCGDTNEELGGGVAATILRVSVSTDPASDDDRAGILEAGRKRLRMLVALKKRNAEIRLGNE